MRLNSPIDRAEFRIGDDVIFFDGSRPLVIGNDPQYQTVLFALDATNEADRKLIDRFKRWRDFGYWRHCEFRYVGHFGGGRIAMEFRVHAVVIPHERSEAEVTLMVRPV